MDDIVINWPEFIRKYMSCYTTLKGEEVYPFENKKQWIEYNRLCYQQQLYDKNSPAYSENISLSKEQVKDLLDFWDHIKKQTKKDETVLSLIHDKISGHYKITPCYREGIKKIDDIKGEKYNKDE